MSVTNSEIASETPLSLLKRVYGYDAFRGLQADVIDDVMAGRDTLAVLPMGGPPSRRRKNGGGAGTGRRRGANPMAGRAARHVVVNRNVHVESACGVV